MFDEIAWLQVFNTNEICLHVTMKVIQELDHHKYNHSNDKIRERAEKVVRKLLKYTDEEKLKERVFIRVDENAPTVDWLILHQYEPANADDCIVGAIEYFKTLNPNAEVVLFSGDGVIYLKAKAKQIRSQIPSDDLKLPPEADSTQKELQKLRVELQKLQNAQPKLEIGFEREDGSFVRHLDLHTNYTYVKSLQEEIEHRLAAKFATLKYIDGIEEDKRNISTINHNLLAVPSILTNITYPSREEVDNYHQSLHKYLQEEYREYLVQWIAYKSKSKLTNLFSIVINNVGSSPARNIDVCLHFPDGLHVFEELDDEPEEPFPPRKPKPQGAFDSVPYGLNSTYLAHFLPSTNYGSYFPSSTTSTPYVSIRKTNSYEVDWSVGDLKHNFNIKLHLYLFLEPIKESKGFEIDYEITADNLINKEEGALSVKFHQV
jgi:hypothetical protein